MPEIKKKPGEMELIGGNGGKSAMFQSIKQELKGDDGNGSPLSDLWVIGAIVVGLYLVMLIVVLVVRMIKKGENAPKKDKDEESEDEEELFSEDLDLEELERKQQLERQQYLSSLSEEEKQELLQQIEEELDEDFRNSLIELGLIDEDYDGDYSEFYPPASQDDKDEPSEKES